MAQLSTTNILLVLCWNLNPKKIWPPLIRSILLVTHETVRYAYEAETNNRIMGSTNFCENNMLFLLRNFDFVASRYEFLSSGNYQGAQFQIKTFNIPPEQYFTMQALTWVFTWRLYPIVFQNFLLSSLILRRKASFLPFFLLILSSFFSANILQLSTLWWAKDTNIKTWSWPSENFFPVGKEWRSKYDNHSLW